MIEKIRLNTEFYNDYQVDGTDVFDNLQQINVLIGANNSGKSRFLRELFKVLSNFDVSSQSENIAIYSKSKDDLYKIVVGIIADFSKNLKKSDNHKRINVLFQPIIERIQKLGTLISSSIYFQILEEFFYLIKKDLIDIRNEEFPSSDMLKDKKSDNFKRFEKLGEIEEIKINDYYKEEKNTKYTFIPTFRTLKKIQNYKIKEKKEDNLDFISPYGQILFDKNVIKHPLLGKIIVDYFIEDNLVTGAGNESIATNLTVNKNSIFNGENLFERIHELQNGKKDKRDILAKFEFFLSENFFSNEMVEIRAIQEIDRKDVYIKIGNEPEFPIHLLGDGIQAIVILTFPLFEYKDCNHLYFVEEPELFLHPGMQRIFLETLSVFNNAQAFIVTHSNHLLDMTIDNIENISVYSFTKELKDNKPNFNIENLTNPDNNILNQLGVRNSSVFLSNCTIWIEGISERFYFRKYLELYLRANSELKTFREDFHFSFIEYSGNNITHWSFKDNDPESNNINANAISNRILLISDRDKGKEERHENLKKNLGDNYYCLKCLEIENLLSPNVLKETISSYKIKGVEKVDFKEFASIDYINRPIAEFIYEIIVNSKQIKKIASVGSDTKTRKIYNKAEFARNAIKSMKNWDELSEEAKEVTIRIYDFISKHNRSV